MDIDAGRQTPRIVAELSLRHPHRYSVCELERKAVALEKLDTRLKLEYCTVGCFAITIIARPNYNTHICVL